MKHQMSAESLGLVDPTADLTAETNRDNYVVVGLATCFLREEGELQQVEIIEPVPAAALEALLKGIPTSYRSVQATTVGALWSATDGSRWPEGFPTDAIFCEDYGERLAAAMRTYSRGGEAAQGLLPLGAVREDLNYSVDRKRLLNGDRLVKAEDNVKQHAYTHQVL